MAKSKIDMQKEFDLQDVNTTPSVVPPVQQLTQEQLDEITRYKQRVEATIAYRKRTVKTPFNADFFPVQGERNTKPSMTIPDQTLPIREILARYAKGLPVSVKTPIYEGEDNNLPDPRTLDLVDIQNLKEAVKEEIKELGKRAIKEDADKKALKAQEEAQKKKQEEDTKKEKEAKEKESKPI